jgi:hypothetical protein
VVRVRDFGANHQDRFPESSPGGQTFATMARIVAEIDTHATNKLVTVREARRLKADRRTVMLERMRVIARTSRGIRTESGSPRPVRSSFLYCLFHSGSPLLCRRASTVFTSSAQWPNGPMAQWPDDPMTR